MKRIRIWLSYLGWIAALFFFIYYLRNLSAAENWSDILNRIDLADFLIASALLFLGLLCRGTSGYLAHRILGFPLTFRQGYRFWFLSQLSKYVPGGIWQFSTRSSLYHSAGMPLVLASALSFWEIAAILLSGIAIILIAGTALSENALVWGAGWLLLVFLLALTQMRRFWRLFARMKFAATMLEMMEMLSNRRLYLNAALVLLSLVGWLFVNLGFHFVVLSLVAGHQFDLSQTFFIYTLAWVAGFLVIIAPGGLGVREAVLIAYYLPLLGEPTAIVISLLARLWWTLAEALHIVLSIFLTTIHSINTR